MQKISKNRKYFDRYRFDEAVEYLKNELERRGVKINKNSEENLHIHGKQKFPALLKECLPVMAKKKSLRRFYRKWEMGELYRVNLAGKYGMLNELIKDLSV